ncbi:uncharacterized protein METZ01_LOCUS319086, partial [marine metagenome]
VDSAAPIPRLAPVMIAVRGAVVFML